IVRAGIAIARIVLRHPIHTQVNSQTGVGENGVAANSIAAAGVDSHAVKSCHHSVGDDVALTRAETSDLIITRSKQFNAMPGIAERLSAIGLISYAVALDECLRSLGQIND